MPSSVTPRAHPGYPRAAWLRHGVRDRLSRRALYRGGRMLENLRILVRVARSPTVVSVRRRACGNRAWGDRHPEQRLCRGRRIKKRPEWRGIHSGRWARPRGYATSTRAGATRTLAGGTQAAVDPLDEGIQGPTAASQHALSRRTLHDATDATHATHTDAPSTQAGTQSLVEWTTQLTFQSSRKPGDASMVTVMPIDFVLFLFSLGLCAVSIRKWVAVPTKLPQRLTNRQALLRRIGHPASRA